MVISMNVEPEVRPFQFNDDKKFWVVMLKDYTNFSLIEDDGEKPNLDNVVELNKDNEDDSVRNYKEGNYSISDQSYTLKGCGEYMSKIIEPYLTKLAIPTTEDQSEDKT